MIHQPLYFRSLQASDIAAGLELCRKANWNQMQRDWEFFVQHCADRSRVALRNEQVIGTVTTISYQKCFSWIGMVLVEPVERGQGIGTALMQQALDILRDQETVKLDATLAGRHVYLPLGFVDEYGLFRMLGQVPVLPELDGSARPMTSDDWDAVCEMDAAIFGAERRALLEWWWHGAPEYAWVLWEGKDLAGYCLGRHGQHFDQLGPVVARNSITAQQLVSACWQGHAGTSFILDVPAQLADWVEWLISLGFAEQRSFTRMVRGSNRYSGLPEYQYAMLGPELG